MIPQYYEMRKLRKEIKSLGADSDYFLFKYCYIRNFHNDIASLRMLRDMLINNKQ